VSAHARNLQLQGQNPQDVDRIGQADPDSAAITPKERTLLGYVKKLTLEPAKVRDTDVEDLRRAGWTDEQIFEASFVTSMFAFFNRMADAYGLDYSERGWRPPDQRGAAPRPGAGAARTPGG
jgi:uncharacterized peroxidase-related enzyme